ncbi:DUF5677 domain-containing protein [Reyranella soli]|uniref:Uncharacterized protein n=1 Tax=Reyranella soli TaxID=1230389 RepID=A0A512NNU2_9HYPH|nr:DUF5677 domain-containing protein [Reyranella soli]GEP60626.1 hypothetical protein RSO01_77920 [Reyranella soli]
MSIARQGFLSPELDDLRAKIRAANPDFFKLAERLSELGQQLLARSQEIQTAPLIVSLFVRGLQSLQGAILLAERGLATEAAIITRSMLETMFYLGALRRDDTFAEELRQDHIKRLSKNAQEFLKLVERDGLGADHAQLKDDLKVLRDREGSGQEIVALRIAERAERRADYDTSYRHLSTSAVHTTVKALAQHWHEDGSGYGIRTGPALPHLIEDVMGDLVCAGYALNEEMNAVVKDGKTAEELSAIESTFLSLVGFGIKNRTPGHPT